MQHRDAAADGGLEQKAHAVRLRKRQKLRAVLGDELLVGCYDVLARSKRAADILQRRAAAADRLHDEKYIRVAFDHGKIRDDQIPVRPVRQLAPRQHIRKLQLFPRVPFEQSGVPQQNFRAAPADDAGAENGGQRRALHHGARVNRPVIGTLLTVNDVRGRLRGKILPERPV